MSAQNNGGSAFPWAGNSLAKKQSEAAGIPYTPPSGMSLRDYFAAKAMQGFLSCGWTMADIGCTMKDGKSIIENYAISAYEYADAMIAARGAK